MTSQQRNIAVAVAAVVLVVIGGVALALRDRGSGGGTAGGPSSTPPPASSAPPPASSTPAPSNGSSSTTSPATASSTPRTSPGSDRCHTSQVAAAFVDTQGAAGSSIGTFTLTNTSSGTCTMFGFPGIALTDGAGNAVVPPPVRNGARGSLVTLAPGQAASFLLQWGNDVNGTGCVTVAKVVITPPDETDSVTIPAVDANGTKITPCGNGATSVESVQPR